MAKNDVLSKIVYEAKAYNSLDDIEKLLDTGMDLSVVPIQPLYVAMLSSSADQVAQLVPKLSQDQRQVFLDLDLWKKDVVDVQSFEFWIETYSKIKNQDLLQDFVSSEDFLLYLKSRINIYTFDVEDPHYPDHDFYFLTDDALLLIEYGEDFKYPNELKYMIRNLYDRMGVEKAYSYLFKLVNDSFSCLQEDLYQQKKERLRSFGFVDYMEALEKTHIFVSHKQVESFIKTKKALTAKVDTLARNQGLHSSALVSFDSEMDNIIRELGLVSDEARLSYLHFTFIRLINSTITMNDALKGGRLELTRIGKVTKAYLELGLQKIKTVKQLGEEDSVFEVFDFFDLYKVGKSLIDLEKNKFIKALRKTPFEDEKNEYFLGSWWTSFLEGFDLEVPKVKSFGVGVHAQEVRDLATYSFWKNQVRLLTESLPFIQSFYQTLESLKAEEKLQDDFYLNYEVADIDFEAILLSAFINFSLGKFKAEDINKMGVSVNELKSFFEKYFIKKDEEYILLPLNEDKISGSIYEFVQSFGLAAVVDFDTYLYGILYEHLSGYEYDTLEVEDYKHIGGPILFNI